MRILIRFLEIMPAILFALIGLYYASRVLVGYFPTEPLAWELFTKLTPVGREIRVLLSQFGLDSAYMAGAFFAVLALGTAIIFQIKRHRRWQFVTAHIALLSVFVGARDENVFVASMDFVYGNGTDILPNFGALQSIHAILLVGILFACASCHRHIIWGIRHPKRIVRAN